MEMKNMLHEKVQLTQKQADGYVIPLGPANLVFVKTDAGLVACGAFDVVALEKFNYPAARVKSANGGPIANVENLLNAVIKDANTFAAQRGIQPGMTGRQALDLL
jgi:uncharacterized protein YunC (DUF1805 family)